jgi:hypothetical protein
MRISFTNLGLCASLPLLPGCQLPQRQAAYTTFANYTGPNEFGAYWFQGEAELSSYDLLILRHGEMRQGEALMIFATEDLSGARQIKPDPNQAPDDDRIAVMKLNKVWRFGTGISDYSLMESVFTPLDLIEHPFSIKQHSTVQDWEGLSFHQLNRLEDGYKVHLFSHLDPKGDQSFSIDPDLLEDELFNRIRINPASVPSGELEMVPGDFFLSLAREPVKPKRARIQFLESEATTQCLVEYLHLDRTVRINFETNFPHRIISWTEEQDQRVVVEGKLRKTIQEEYWTKTSGKSQPLRDSLKLSY